MSVTRLSRRDLGKLASLVVASPVLQAQELVGEPPGRITPLDELVNVFEVEAMASRKLPGALYSTIAGSSRRAFDRLTFRPRMLVDVTQLDMSTELFGEKIFAPILLGPIAGQKQIHPEGELASVRAASAAKTVMVVSSRSSYPLEEIAAQSKTTLWYQVYPELDMNAARSRMQEALRLGCKAVCLTVGIPYPVRATDAPPHPSKLQAMATPHIDWNGIDQLRRGIRVPFLLKGIMSPEAAQLALQRGAEGIVVSNHGGMFGTGLAEPIEMLPPIVDAVGGKVPVLIDGSFRRGTDVLKALALGARAVLVARPPMWGLAAYGSEGVRAVLQMFQSELARSMALSGKPNIKAIDRSLVKIHLR